jgi:hypothetical protein
MTQIAPDTFRPHDVAGRRSGHTDPLPPFASVVCLVDGSPAGHAARQQAAALAGNGAEEIIATPRPGRGSSALLDRCDGADLLDSYSRLATRRAPGAELPRSHGSSGARFCSSPPLL